MKERPILFGAPMVRAILSGAKTQTRRIVKPQPAEVSTSRPGLVRLRASDPTLRTFEDASPYGRPGDRLWVRETFAPFGEGAWHRADFAQRYGAWERDEPSGGVLRMEDRWTPAIHMPRWASRIDLDVTEVRVERLQAITEEDALAEGVSRIHHGRGEYYYSATRDEPHPQNWCSPDDAFRALWDSINGKRAPFASNPWVWVVSFKRAESAAVAA